MLATRLKELRESNNLSQAAFAKEFGISCGAIGNWESGKRVPDLATLQKIADFFGVSINSLTGTSQTTEEIKKARQTVADLAEQQPIDITNFENTFDTNYQTLRAWLSGASDYFDTRLSLLADYFNVTVDYLLGRPAITEAPTPEDAAKVALFGGNEEVTPEMWEEVKNYADYVKAKYKKETE